MGFRNENQIIKQEKKRLDSNLQSVGLLVHVCETNLNLLCLKGQNIERKIKTKARIYTHSHA